MFTGLIEAVGQVLAIRPIGGGYQIRLASGLAGELRAGDSLAVNGVCLTMVYAGGGELQADIGPETARVTNLGDLRTGSLVNLERPLRADARLGGHFVQGHVDGTGRVEEIRQAQDFWWFTIAAILVQLLPKGSIAVDGVSLTAAGLGAGRIDIMIIPYTWDHTNFRAMRAGDRVNLECDMLGKYVVRLAELGLIAAATQESGTGNPESGAGRDVGIAHRDS
jgi:riboflavin synthase